MKYMATEFYFWLEKITVIYTHARVQSQMIIAAGQLGE